jgi:hypothetical protein
MSRNRTRLGLSALTFAGLISVGAAAAQTPSPPPEPSTPTAAASRTAASTLADIEKWTSDEWDAAKAKWSKENAKWGECEQQATDQKLIGRQSWTFLYKCMF